MAFNDRRDLKTILGAESGMCFAVKGRVQRETPLLNRIIKSVKRENVSHERENRSQGWEIESQEQEIESQEWENRSQDWEIESQEKESFKKLTNIQNNHQRSGAGAKKAVYGSVVTVAGTGCHSLLLCVRCYSEFVYGWIRLAGNGCAMFSAGLESTSLPFLIKYNWMHWLWQTLYYPH